MVSRILGEKPPTVLQPPGYRAIQLSFLGLGLAFSGSLALLVTTYLLGRASLLQATKQWLGLLLVLFLVSALWQTMMALALFRLPGARGVAALRPAFAWSLGLTLAMAALDAGVYLSDGVNHGLTVDPAFRGAFLVVAALLLYATYRIQGCLLDPGRDLALSQELRWQFGRDAGPALLIASGAIGLLAGSSYVTVMGDDYARYWAIADALRGGWGYPASEVGSVYQAGGMSSYLVDLPGLPVAMLLSFALAGHNVLGAMLPALLAGSLFTLAAYLTIRELTGDSLVGFVGAVALSLFPLFSFYVLRAAEPDGMFVTLAMLLVFLAIRCESNPRNRGLWPALGVVAGLAALTRPEGLAYLGVTFLSLALTCRRHRGFWMATGLSAALLGLFSISMILTFGVPWPTSFAGTAGLAHVGQNLEGFVVYALPRYSTALGVPQPLLLLAAALLAGLYGLGSWLLARRRPGLLFLALLPAVSLAIFLLVSPALTRPQQPYDFFRRASYGLPFITLVASYPVALGLRRLSKRRAEWLAVGALLLGSLAMVSYEARLWSEPEETYDLGTQVLTSGLYIQATDLVAHPYPLPSLPFERDGQAVMVSNSFDYLDFRTRLNGFFAPSDLHGTNRARGYPSAALAIFVAGAAWAIVSRKTPAARQRERSSSVARPGRILRERRIHLWNLLLSSSLALSATVALLGRTWPTQATLGWALTYLLLFLGSATWLTLFSVRLSSRHPEGCLRRVVAAEAPLLLISAAGSAALYLSDDLYHQLTYFLQPTPMVLLLLTVMATATAQQAMLSRRKSAEGDGLAGALVRSRRWALPASLLLLGLVQGSSYLWVIGNDFTRYWSIADSVGSLAGYATSVNLNLYLQGGMYRYSIELPLFPLLLLSSFRLLGHDTLGAHAPALLANTLLPLVLYGFYRAAGFGRLLAYLGSCVVVLFPFFRLYTLNAPVPDAIFVTLLVATGYLWLRFTGGIDGQNRGQPAPKRGAGASGPTGLSRILAALSASFRQRFAGIGTVMAAETGIQRTDRGLDPRLRGDDETMSRTGSNDALRRPSAAGNQDLRWWAAFGLLAALTALTRPEGLLFLAFMGLGLLPGLLHRGLYLAAGLALALMAPFSLMMVRIFGIPWPRNAGDSFGLENVALNLEWLGRLSLRWYADPFGLSTSGFVLVVWLLSIAALAGTILLARRRWTLALLPLAAALHTFLVFTVHPLVSGVDQWFDIFRHISYGIPFVLLPLLLLGRELSRKVTASGALPAYPAALVLLIFSAYELHLLAQPALTYGRGATQLLTSDVWVTMPDIVAHRYPLPELPFAPVEGLTMIDPAFGYMATHLERVKAFFDPFSILHTGKGYQYEVSSLLTLLFGAAFALVEGRPRHEKRTGHWG